MKITDVKVMLVAPDEGGGPSTVQRRTWTLVRVETDEGISGVGDASGPAGGGSHLSAMTLNFVKDSLIGEDPNDIEMLWHKLYRRFTYVGSRGLITRIISGINIALWDLKGKALGRPVYDLLGGKMRDNVQLYNHIRPTTPDDSAAHAKQLVAQGYTALKTDPFAPEMSQNQTGYVSGNISPEGEQAGVDIIAAVREAVGPRIQVLIDCHGHYNVAAAIRIGKRLAPYDITWLEEPVPPESYKALRHVKENTGVPICVGERLYTRFDFAPVLEDRLAEFIMPDVCWTGGISELRKIANMAETYYVPVSPHNVQSALQILAGAHTMMTIPNFYRLEFNSANLERYNSILDTPLDIRDGYLHLSDRPGLGIELNMDYINKHLETGWMG